MSARPVSDAVLQATVNIFAEHGNNQAHAAAALNIGRRTLQERLMAAKKRGIAPGGKGDPDDVQALKAKVKRLETELKGREKEADQAEIIKSVIGGMARKVEALDPPKWIVKPSTTVSAPGVPTLFLSDWHGGERVSPAQINGVNEYSVAIMHERAHTLVDSAVHLLKIISPQMMYPGIVVPLGGDMISGNIHDELTATNEMNSMPAVEDLYTVLVGVIKALADRLGNVFLPCVTGNHGRNTKKIWHKDRHATSFDWLLYRFLALYFADDRRVTFYIPDGIAAHYKIYGYRYRLAHGDKLGKGGDGIIGAVGPIIRGDLRTRSRDAQIDLGYDTQLVAHFHQYWHLGRVIVNGSLKGYDELAMNEGYAFEQPQQALWLTHPKYGITYRMPVYVDRKRAPAETAWVSVPKTIH
ncbi:MAG: helix-turn-helix domain-containing protein [Candidatus Nanopelagicales bacterium]|nr:helix-turn-helix domain-containing protein [Candidatus Nanopelagicales bacterium]